jgi:sugar phosphate isomerase/epimerase
MRPIGFSTGALAKGRFREGLDLLAARGVRTVELSALRGPELPPLLGALPDLDLAGFDYVSLHAPSRVDEAEEEALAAALLPAAARGVPVILHPDALHRPERFRPLGACLLIENMDRRKRTGQTAADLAPFFEALPEASLCLDVGHAWQVDPTLSAAHEILARFGGRLRQLHVSEVDAGGGHRPLSDGAVAAFRALAPLIPEQVPLILEAAVPP